GSSTVWKSMFVRWPGSTWPTTSSMLPAEFDPPWPHGRYRLRRTGSKIIFPHGAPFDTLTCPVDDAAFVQTRPPVASLEPVDPGPERICGPSGTGRYSRKSVLSVGA